MKKRKYTQGITFFTTTEMYEEIKRITDQNEIGLSEFLRDLIDQYLNSNRDPDKSQDSHESS